MRTIKLPSHGAASVFLGVIPYTLDESRIINSLVSKISEWYICKTDEKRCSLHQILDRSMEYRVKYFKVTI